MDWVHVFLATATVVVGVMLLVAVVRLRIAEAVIDEVSDELNEYRRRVEDTRAVLRRYMAGEVMTTATLHDQICIAVRQCKPVDRGAPSPK